MERRERGGRERESRKELTLRRNWRFMIFDVVFAENRDDGFRGLFCMIKRHAREHMVSNMCVMDVAFFFFISPTPHPKMLNPEKNN